MVKQVEDFYTQAYKRSNKRAFPAYIVVREPDEERN
jgi:hypothetical protein